MGKSEIQKNEGVSVTVGNTENSYIFFGPEFEVSSQCDGVDMVVGKDEKVVGMVCAGNGKDPGQGEDAIGIKKVPGGLLLAVAHGRSQSIDPKQSTRTAAKFVTRDGAANLKDNLENVRLATQTILSQALVNETTGEVLVHSSRNGLVEICRKMESCRPFFCKLGNLQIMSGDVFLCVAMGCHTQYCGVY